ncbi:hypothetical protein [Catellatospora chokoriensis]|uniref:hypothetical protein n=1 Tax=Catellatospora chokoriensis TaxID=310353 RepID=UPI0017825533|nr:hypothetical protein [Catellatospora chokoriensis]
MDLLPCGPVAPAGPGRMCRHLLGDDASAARVRLLTGRGLEFDMCCPASRRRATTAARLCRPSSTVLR